MPDTQEQTAMKGEWLRHVVFRGVDCNTILGGSHALEAGPLGEIMDVTAHAMKAT